MDSAHLLHLGFLLLALAAPHPNIAMSTVGSAEGTEGSSPASIDVTVFLCKGCNNCTCNSGEQSFEDFDEIAAIQNKNFSDLIIDFATSKTHTTVCFKQANSCLEGVYGFYWEKAGGKELSCGILNSEENGRDNINTEKNICCKAETNTWRNNPPLECYIQKSHPKHITVPPDIADEGLPGNPEFLTSKENNKKSNTGTLLALLFVVALIGSATMYCFFCRRRRGQASRQDKQTQTSDRESLIHL